MENKKPFLVMLALCVLFSFLGIQTDLPFIPKDNHNLYIYGRLLWGSLNVLWFVLLISNKITLKNVLIPYMITMMLYSFHGQWFVPCYYLAFVEILCLVGLFFPVNKKQFRIVATISTILMCWVVLNSPATYNSVDPLIDAKFRYDALIAVLLISFGALLGHTYVTMKRQEKDEAYRKFLDIGKYSSFLFHDFKGLLSTPIFYADMLTQTIKTGASSEEIILKLNEDLAFIQDYSKEIMKLTLPDNQSYDVKSKIDIQHFTKTLNVLLRKPLNGINFQIEVKDIPEKEVNVYQLVKVFYNAILNSLESINSNKVSNPTIKIYFDKEKIEIRDNGKGFSKDILKKINQEEIIVSTKENGSGIGTAIIKDLIKNMDGKVSFYNDNGAVVLINL